MARTVQRKTRHNGSFYNHAVGSRFLGGNTSLKRNVRKIKTRKGK